QIVAGGTQADMDMLGDKAIEIGGKTSKGAQEVVEAMVDFAKLGFTATETADAMEGIVYAAEASGSAVDTTAQIVAAALNTWNLAAGDSEHIADVLAETANKTAADMTDLGYTFQYAGASAQLGGASMEQLAAYTGIMADQGIRGSKAGTALRTAFTNLTSPTDKAAAALDELGIKLEDAEGKARP
ncbi:phage tail tape measure protein, partial [Enterococcus faecium]|uniref:phage tail tape measure protein n=2 Tax=Bacillati TaxID=1783272 RepID=UPI003F89C303